MKRQGILGLDKRGGMSTNFLTFGRGVFFVRHYV